jgi:uncharacterized membrane protein YfcA
MNRRILLKLVGILICLTAAYMMFDGTIFGADTPGYATVLGIFGIGIISTGATVGLKRRG